MNPDLQAQCSRHFRFVDLIQCGETWKRNAGRIDVLPRHPGTWEMLSSLAQKILDPVVDEYGPVVLTYAFAPQKLTKKIFGRIDPSLDQHASCELNRVGRPICVRGGAAVDFLVEHESMIEVARFVSSLPVDRMYFYGDARPLHVSWHPQPKRSLVEMMPTRAGRLMPRPLQFDRIGQKGARHA